MSKSILMHRRTALGLAGAGALSLPNIARAQPARGPGNWPERPVSWIVGFPPGGQTDFAARVLQGPFSRAIGQPVPIENRGGAGGNIAAEQVLRARPDGYTLTVGNAGTLVLNPHTMQGVNFDPMDLVPIGMMLQSPLLLLVHPDVPARNFQEWVTWMRSQQPRGIDMGTTSAGGIAHAISEKLRMRLGNPVFNFIHYRGTGPALPDFISGRFQTMFEAPSNVHGFVQEGKLRPILVTSNTRLPAFPNVPNAEESGLPNFETGGWIGLFGPRGLPPELAQHINNMLNIACRDEEARNRMAERGDQIGGGTIEEFTRRVRAEHAEWGRIVREAGIRAE